MSDRDRHASQPSTGERSYTVPAEVPVLPLRDTVLFPNSFMPLAVARESSVKLIDDAIAGGKLIGVFTQRDPTQEEPGQADLHAIGTLTHIHKMFKLPDGSLRLIVQGLDAHPPRSRHRDAAVPARGGHARRAEVAARRRRARSRRAPAQRPRELPAGRAAVARAVRRSDGARGEHHRAGPARRFHRVEPRRPIGDRGQAGAARDGRTCARAWTSSTAS